MEIETYVEYYLKDNRYLGKIRKNGSGVWYFDPYEGEELTYDILVCVVEKLNELNTETK